MQSEDDCAGYETTGYTLYIDDQEVGDMTADMLGLSSFTKRGDMAVVTLTVPTLHSANSPRFNVTVMLSNTVEFTEVITSSTDGVSSTLRSNTWSTTSFYCECKLEFHGIVCSLVNKPTDSMMYIIFYECQWFPLAHMYTVLICGVRTCSMLESHVYIYILLSSKQTY